MDTAQRTESIKNLVDNVASSNVVLPEFQRDFVWDIAKTYDLFDSLIRDIFIGSIIYGIPSFEITVREVDTRPRKGDGSKRKLKISSFNKYEIDEKVKVGNFRLLLDGQQRVTSIYRALKGIDSVWIIIKNDSELDKSTLDKSITERNLEDVLYAVEGKESASRLSINISTVYDMLEGKITREKEKAELLEQSEYCKTMQLSDVQASDVFEQYLSLSNKIQDLFKGEKLVSYYMLNTDTNKFSLFFERSNSKGVQLDFIDILAAKVYGGFKLRDAVEAFQDANKEYELNREVIVRAISFIVSHGKNVDRTYILSTLNYQHFKDYWSSVCNIYISCYQYLSKNHYLLSQGWIPYENMLIPLMIFLREIPSNDFSQINEFQSKFLKYWYWASIFSQKYSTASNEVIEEDARLLKEIANGRMDIDRAYLSKLNLQISSPDDLLYISKKGNALYRGVLNLINYHTSGFLDFKNTSLLSFNSKLEEHHIFPRDYLKRKYEGEKSDNEFVDSVLNKTLLPKITNIKVSNKAPSIYLDELKDDNPNIQSSLKSHMIPLEILDGAYDDCFSIFLEDRGKLIYSVIRDEILLLRQEFEANDDPDGSKLKN